MIAGTVRFAYKEFWINTGMARTRNYAGAFHVQEPRGRFRRASSRIGSDVKVHREYRATRGNNRQVIHMNRQAKSRSAIALLILSNRGLPGTATAVDTPLRTKSGRTS